MTTIIKIKRGSGFPTSLSQAELAFDNDTGRLWIGDVSSPQQILQLTSDGLATFYQEPINDQIDATIAPDSSPTKETIGARFILEGTPHANWDGADENDIVEWDGTNSTWEIVFDASVSGKGVITWDNTKNILVSFNGTNWVLAAAVSKITSGNPSATTGNEQPTGVTIGFTATIDSRLVIFINTGK